MALKPEPQTIDMTAEQAAAIKSDNVVRFGQDMTAEQAAAIAGIPVTDLLSFKDYGSKVVVVTRYGKKITQEIPPIPPLVKGGEAVSQPVSTITPGPAA